MAKNKSNNFKNTASGSSKNTSGSSKNSSSGSSKNSVGSSSSMKDTHSQVPGSGPNRSGPGGE